MKKRSKIILALGCVLALMAGTAVSAGVITRRMLEVEYMGITLEVNGRQITPIGGGGDPVEPFAVDGTTYVPVRVLGDILGKDVVWDTDTRTIRIGEAPFVEDGNELVAYIEGAHPVFLLGQEPDGYKRAKEELLAVAADPKTTLADFSWAALGYTASLKDGHTTVSIFGNRTQPQLDIEWMAVGGALYLAEEKGTDDKTQVAEIGGAAVDKVFSVIDTYFAAENAAAQERNYALYSRDANVLIKAGAVLNQDQTVTVKLTNVPERKVEFAQAVPAASEKVIAAEMKDDVYYIDLNSCVVGAETTAVANDLKAAIEKGTQKVIIDVRGNGGGNSNAPLALLHAMGMEAPDYGSYTRYSVLALDETQAPYLPDGVRRNYQQVEGGEQTAKPSTTAAKGNPKIQLVVLTDADTYSSATMLGVWVQDGKLGTVMGRPSTNAPSHYGDILYYSLTNTGLYGTTSHVQWQRPNSSADPATLVPDVETQVGKDALEAALDHLKEK